MCRSYFKQHCGGLFYLRFAYLHPPTMHEVAPLRGNKMQILSESEFHALNACPHAPTWPKFEERQVNRGPQVLLHLGHLYDHAVC